MRAAQTIQIPVYAALDDAQVRRDVCRRDASLFVWGYAPAFYLTTGLRPASRFLWVDSTLVGHVSGARANFEDSSLILDDHRAWLLENLARTRPTYIVDAARAGLWRWHHEMQGFPQVADLVASYYDRMGDFDGVSLYRRRDCGAEPKWRFAEAPTRRRRGLAPFGGAVNALRRRLGRGRG